MPKAKKRAKRTTKQLSGSTLKAARAKRAKLRSLALSFSAISVVLVGIIASVLFLPQIVDTNRALLNISVNAKGETDEEVINLIIDNKVVAVFELSDDFKTYKYNNPFSVAADDIKIQFVNSGKSINGDDRKVILDYIDVEGERFNTSTSATYQMDDVASDQGCEDNDDTVSKLKCGGVLSFDVGDAGVVEELANKQRITIVARGHAGDENMNLKINDKKVKSWTVGKDKFMSYVYGYEGTIGDKAIKVEFTNDGNSKGVNRNLDIDYITVNDKIFQGEADTVFSTGTWTPDNGCDDGYKKKARLSCNGYMQFNIGDAAVAVTPPPIKAVDDQLSVEVDGDPTVDDSNTRDIAHIDHDHEEENKDPSTFGGVNPTPQVPVGNTDLSQFDNPLVVPAYANVASRNLNINSLTTTTNKTIANHSNQGQFRTRCQYSHLAYDDPIVYPGQPGAAHLHMFFGNTNTNASTTNNSLLNSGGGSCQGGELNRTAYWIPAVFDNKDQVRVPFDTVIYYKSYGPSKTVEFPVGLKMLTDTAANAKGKVKWSCASSRNASNDYNSSTTIPNCNNGDFLKASIGFPECWNGQLDSANHKSHLAYGKGTGGSYTCPSSHPKVLPKISYLIYFEHEGQTNNWYLSSDRFNGANFPNGSTLHADWYGGWNQEVMSLWTETCTTKLKNCGVGRISQSLNLSNFSKDNRYQGPSFLPKSNLLKPQR